MNKNSKLKILLYLALALIILFTLVSLISNFESMTILSRFHVALNFGMIIARLISLFFNLIDKVILIMVLISLFTKNKIFRIISSIVYLLTKILGIIMLFITYIVFVLDSHYISDIMTYYHFSYLASLISSLLLISLIIILLLGIFKIKGKKILFIGNILISGLALLHAFFGNILLIIIYNMVMYYPYNIWQILRIIIINPVYFLIPSICLMNIYLVKESINEKC